MTADYLSLVQKWAINQSLDCSVAEAKARLNRPPTVLYSIAKSQASRIVSIKKTSPKTHCASVADLSSLPISVYCTDPEEGTGEYEITRIEVDDDQITLNYSLPLPPDKSRQESVSVLGIVPRSPPPNVKTHLNTF